MESLNAETSCKSKGRRRQTFIHFETMTCNKWKSISTNIGRVSNMLPKTCGVTSKRCTATITIPWHISICRFAHVRVDQIKRFITNRSSNAQILTNFDSQSWILGRSSRPPSKEPSNKALHKEKQKAIPQKYMIIFQLPFFQGRSLRFRGVKRTYGYSHSSSCISLHTSMMWSASYTWFTCGSISSRETPGAFILHQRRSQQISPGNVIEETIPRSLHKKETNH